MNEVKVLAYVVRWDKYGTFGSDVGDLFGEPYCYLKNLLVAPAVRRAGFADTVDDAIKFGSWAEAAAMAVFIIHHVDEMYEDALEVVKIDLPGGGDANV